MPTYPTTPKPLATPEPEERLALPQINQEFDRIVRHVRNLHEVRLRAIRLPYRATQAEFEAFRAFYDSVRGPAIPFTFTHPRTGATYQARLTDEALRARVTGVGDYEWIVQIEEVP